MKTKVSRYSSRIFIGIMALMMVFSTLIVVSTITASADTITLYYQANMPSGNYSASSSKTMTMSSNNNSKYYVAFSLTANTSYGFYIKWGNDYYKANATASSDADVLLYNYGSNNYGNSNHRVTYTPGSSTSYVFTFDTSNNKITVSPRTSSTVKLAWQASPASGAYNMDNYSNMSWASNGTYTYSMYMQKGTTYGMFVQIAESRYYKANATLSTSGSVTLYDYGTDNFGNSSDRASFTPETGGYYKFTWNHDDKTLKVAKTTLPYSGKTFKISDNITGAWDSNATNTMSGTSTSKEFTYYLKKDEADVYFRFYNLTDSQIFGAETNNQEVSTTIGTSTRTDIGRENSFHITNNTALSESGKYYAVKVTFDLTANSNSGGVKYSATAKDNLTASINADKPSYNVTSGSGGITFTGTATNLFGSGVTYQFYRSSDNGATWSSVRSASSAATYNWSNPSVGSYKFKVRVVDTTVKNGTNARSDRYVESEAIDVSVVEGRTYEVNKAYKIGTNSAVSDGTAEIGDSSARATTLSFPLYRTYDNVRYKLTSFDVSGVTKKSENLSAGTGTFYASAAGGTITANYAEEADYKQLYFKNTKSWGQVYAYLWNVSAGGTASHNNAFPGVQIPDGDYTATSISKDDYGVCDYVGRIKVQNGASYDTYYYYKTYNTDVYSNTTTTYNNSSPIYDRMIFSDGTNPGNTGTTKTGDLFIDWGSLQNSNNISGTYQKNSMYYDMSDGKWHPIPAALYDVQISATDTETKFNGANAASATGTVTKSAVAVNSSTTDTVTITAPSGYTIDTTTPLVTSSGITISNGSFTSSNTKYTFTVKSTNDGTITPNYIETRRTISVYRRMTTRGGTVTTSSAATYYAGVATTATLAVPSKPTDYKQNKWMTSAPAGITVTSGSLNSNSEITVNATANATIYFEFTEDLHTVAFQNDGNGVVKEGSATITTKQLGNITAATLTATANEGFKFKEWQKISGASNVTIGDTSLAETTFKATGDATVKAIFEPVGYSINATFPSGSTYDSHNAINSYETDGTTIKTGGQIGDDFQIRVKLYSGYEMSTTYPQFTTTGTNSVTGHAYKAPTYVSETSSTSGAYTTVVFTYKMPAGDVKATVTLQAIKPSLKGFMKNNTAGFNSYTSSSTQSTANHALSVDNYYLQPVDLKAQTDTFSDIGYSVNGTAQSLTPGSNSSNDYNEVYDPPAEIIPTTEDGSITYQVVITATNAKAGVTAKTTTCTITVNVTFNAEQKAFFKMKRLYQHSVAETATTAATYYDAGAPWATYQSQRETVNRDYGTNNWNEWPEYNSTAATYANAYSGYFNAFKALQAKAKTTTVYVLSRYNNNTNNYVSINGTSNGTEADFDRYKQYHYYLMDPDASSTAATYIKGENDNVDHLMKYEGRAGSTYYLYSYTYAGKANARIYVSSTKAGLYTDSANASRRLTGTVTGLSNFGSKYYINVYNTTYSSSASTSTASTFVDLHTERQKTGKAIVEKSTGSNYRAADIRDLLGIGSDYPDSQKGSLHTDNPQIAISETGFTIQKPNTDETVNLLSTDSSNNKWTPSASGTYEVKYKVKYSSGVDSDASNDVHFEKEDTFYIYVAHEEIDVYVDMNDNVGTPTLNFNYTLNGTSGVLPYDMSLVSGSESIYTYKVNLKKLNDYNISYKSGNNLAPITINSIAVDKVKYTNDDNGFTINTDAYLSGSVWFKANSTTMSNFECISNSSVTNTFRAIVEDYGTHIPNAIEHISGTGVKTDEVGTIDGIFKDLYAGRDSESSQINKVFGYVVKAQAGAEAELNGTKYYFDRWMSVKTPEGGGDTEDYFEDNDHYSALTDLGKDGNNRTYQLSSAPEINSDTTYVAIYKPVSTSGVARVEVTYNFKDYNTEDGNYEYDATKALKDASYTKTVKVSFGAGKEYSNYEAVKEAYNTIAEDNMPFIRSNYFDYHYPDDDSKTTTLTEHDDSNYKLKVKAVIPDDRNEETPVCTKARTYTIALYNDNDSTPKATKTGNYQQTAKLTAGEAGLSSSGENVNWYVKDGNTDIILHKGSTFTTRFIQYGFTSNSAQGDSDKIYIYAKAGTESVDKTSVIINSYNEYYKDASSDTDKVRHNYYIIDYLDKADTETLVGAGTLVATTKDGTTYSQANAGTVFSSDQNKIDYITSALKTGTGANQKVDYDTERPQQTIENISFRYIPFDSTLGRNTLRYSDALKGYHYVYGLQNSLSDVYSGQTIRVYSFFIYKNGSTYTTVVSRTYAELSRI